MVTDPSAVAFCNQQIRPVSDDFVTGYRLAKLILAAWSAKGLAAIIPNDTTVIADGSAADGRTQITGADVYQIIGACQNIVTLAESTNVPGFTALLKASVNPR